MPKGFCTRRFKFSKPEVRSSSTSHGRLKNPLVDDGDNNIYDEDVYDFKIDFSDLHPPRDKVDTTVSLLDIARPAKKKGIVKEFEVNKSAPKAPLLDNEEFEIWEDDLLWDDDWEKIHDEQRIDNRPSYSSVLRRKHR